MKKSILVEVNRMKEIMGLRLLMESSLPFFDEFIEKLAKNAEDGDMVARNLFSDIFQDDAAIVIDDLVQNKRNVDTIFNDKDLLGDFMERAFKSTDKIDGMTAKNIFYDTLENSLDDAQSQLGKDLKDIGEKINNLSRYESEPDLYNQAIDALEEMKKQINDVFSNDAEIQKIVNSSAGLDNIPAKKVIGDVAEEESESVLRGAKEILDPKKWPTTSGLSKDEIEKISKKVDENLKNFFRNWSTSNNSKLVEITKILKTLRESGNSLPPGEKLALEKQFSKLMNDLYLNNRKLFGEVQTWFGQISKGDSTLAQVVNKLSTSTDSFTKILAVAEANSAISNWLYSFKRALSDAFAGEVRLLNKVFKTIENKEWFKKYFGESANKTAKEAEGGLWEWLYSGSRRGYPLSSNKNWKKVIEESGLPAAKKAYAMELLIRTAKWKILFATLATLRNGIAFASNKTNLTQCKVALDNLKNEIDQDESLTRFKQGNNYLIPLEPINDENGNPYKTKSGVTIIIPNDCKINNAWQMWGQDFAQGEEGSRWISDFSNNLLSTTWGDDLTDLFPGKLDDVALFISDTMSWWQKDKSWEDFAAHLDEEIVIAQQKMEEGNEKLETVVNNTGEKIDDDAQQGNLDSLNVKKPDVPPTPSIKEGTASEEDKISFKNYLKDDDLFNNYNKIDQGDKPGVIILRYKKKKENGEMEDKTQTLYKDSEGTWRYKQSNNPY
jgi:hypothetical protein